MSRPHELTLEESPRGCFAECSCNEWSDGPTTRRWARAGWRDHLTAIAKDAQAPDGWPAWDDQRDLSED